MGRFNSTLANTLWRVSCEPARKRLQRALLDPEVAQAAVIQRLLAEHSGTLFARNHGLRAGMSITAYQKAVPVGDYDSHQPMIERLKKGESDVLSPGGPLAFERSSGSTAGAKYIPFNAALRDEFHEAVRAWMGDLFARHGSLLHGPAYWLISPLRHPCETTAGGIPIGLAGDDEYLGPWQRRIASQIWAVPPSLAQVGNLDESLLWTLRFLLQAPELRLISVWNPSYLTLLWKRLLLSLDELLDGLRDGTGPGQAFPVPSLKGKLRKMPERAERLRGKKDALTPHDVWPQLAIISAWADGEAGRDAAAVQQLFSQAVFQPKGLLATEGVITIPWGDDKAAGVPALHSHFLEFMEWPDGSVRLVHELEPGREYAVLLTTGGGLWRYRLGDLVHVEGRVAQTPRLRFAGRCDEVCDLRGEKLNPRFVAEVLASFSLGFRLLAPCRGVDPPHYILFAAGSLPSAEEVDHALRANPHYDHARAIGQLGAVRVFEVQDADPVASWLRRCVSLGQRAGTVKASAMHRSPGWERWFSGHFVKEGA